VKLFPHSTHVRRFCQLPLHRGGLGLSLRGAENPTRDGLNSVTPGA
jgi:hypothetical protein